jgi:hypothetical protein
VTEIRKKLAHICYGADNNLCEKSAQRFVLNIFGQGAKIAFPAHLYNDLRRNKFFILFQNTFFVIKPGSGTDASEIQNQNFN